MKESDKLHGGRVLDIAASKGVAPKELLDFSANISPFGPEESLQNRIRAGIEELQHYPSTDREKLCALVGKIHGVEAKHIYLGNGAADVIYKLAAMLAAGGKKLRVLVTAPGFAEYEKAFAPYRQAEIVYYPLDRQDMCVKEDIFSFLQDVDVFFLCSPNNPTGKLTEGGLLHRIMQLCERQKKVLILDECFMDFCQEDAGGSIPRIHRYRQLVVLRSFTKLFAIPGLRLGYALTGREDWIENLEALTPAWHLNSLSAGILPLLSELYEGVREKNRRLLAAERPYMQEALRALGLQVYDTDANFLLFKAEEKPEKSLAQALLARNILLRSCDNFRGLGGGYYRSAIRTHEENRVLIAAIREYFS